MPSKSEVIMKKIKVSDAVDLSGHLVAMNQLFTELSRLTRQTYKPDYQAIASIASQIKMHISVVETLAKKETT
jgi:hypothetical protein